MPQHLKRCAFVLLAAALIAPAAPAQSAASAPQTTDTTARPPEFDVVSIRPNKDNAQMSGNGTFSSWVGIRNLRTASPPATLI